MICVKYVVCPNIRPPYLRLTHRHMFIVTPLIPYFSPNYVVTFRSEKDIVDPLPV